VLVADDDVLLREFISLQVEELGCRVSTAEDGQKACDALDAGEFDVLITDWQMPEMDGTQLIERLRARPPSDRYLYIILVTTRAAERTIRAGLQAGADDFMYKPLDQLQLELALASARRIVDLQHRLSRRNQHLSRAHSRVRDAYRRIRSDLQAAAVTQREMLPQPRFTGGPLRHASIFIPSMGISGDTLGVDLLDEGRWMFFHVDVSGHGVPAALSSVSAHHQLSMLRPTQDVDLPRGIASLNEQLYRRPGDIYATMVCGLADMRNGHVQFVRAGHPLPLVLPARGEPRFVDMGGPPVGLLPHAEFPVTEIALAPGDRLLLYSDGVTECTSPGDEEFGDDRLAQAAVDLRGENLEAFVNGLRDRLVAHRGSTAFEDDVSMLVIERA
jgi:sigma-B regulation protein RsbU (phosphoserine phosphatase)